MINQLNNIYYIIFLEKYNTTVNKKEEPVEELKPEGRLRECPGGLKLLNRDEAMYIPITQEPAPMTEDMLDEHAEILTRYFIRKLCCLNPYYSNAPELIVHCL